MCIGNDAPRDRQRVFVAGREVVGHSRPARVDVGAAELLGRHHLAGRRLHEGRAADEDRAGALDDHRLVAHRRHVRAARGARPHHHGNLRDALRRHARLVEEDPPEVVAVGEHLGLEREERAPGIDQVDAREVVLLGNLLGAQVLLDGEREVRPALDGRIVRDDHAFASLDDTDPGHDARARRLVVVDVEGGKCVELEEGGARVDEPIDAVTGEQLSAGLVPLARTVAAARGHRGGALAQLRDERGQASVAPREVVGPLDPALQERHRAHPNAAGDYARHRRDGAAS